MPTSHKAEDIIADGMNLAVDNPDDNDVDNEGGAKVDIKVVCLSVLYSIKC